MSSFRIYFATVAAAEKDFTAIWYSGEIGGSIKNHDFKVVLHNTFSAREARGKNR